MGKFGIPKGALETKDSHPFIGALRELKEETGVEWTSDFELVDVVNKTGNLNNISSLRKRDIIIYVVRINPSSPRPYVDVCDKNEISEVKWVDIDEFKRDVEDKNIYNYCSRFYLTKLE